MIFGEKILDYKEELIRDLSELIAVQSVSAEKSQCCEEALDLILSKAEKMGFTTKKVSPVCGHVEYGSGEKLSAVLAHVDVVPAGDGWGTEPFVLTEKDGRYFGRGVVDDKGPAMTALYCLKALKDNGIEPSGRIRLIFGAAEEVGMDDMTQYFASEEMPAQAFTPDSAYGICLKEKGILQMEITSPYHDGTTLTEFHSGNALNAVPSKAYALIDCTETEDHQLRRFADAKPGRYDFIYTMDGLRIDGYGKAAHASTPDEGLNAATHLIRILAAEFGQTVLGSLCSFIDDAIGLETDGMSLGISCSDQLSGALSLCVSRVDIDDNESKAYIDIRYPVSADSSEICNIIRERASYDGLRARVISHELPLNMDENAPIVEILKTAYKNVTGEEAELYSTGGGTYARTLNNCGVAFGPEFPGDPVHIHEPDESISVENFWKHACICLEAIKGMAES